MVSERIEYFVKRLDEYVDLLESLVGLESPSMHPRTNELVTTLAGLLEDAGGDVERINSPDASDCLVARWGVGNGGVLLLAHADTVWPEGEIQRRPFRIEHHCAWGPGTHDMKGSLAMGICVMKALHERGDAVRRPVTLVVNTDEESGSPCSRQIIEREALNSVATLVLEPPGPNGELKTARKGVGIFEFEIRGRTAHAGYPEKGKSAVLELARLVKRLHAMTNPASGVYVNVGVVEGGRKANIVPDYARAAVDLRVPSMALAAEMEHAISSVGPSDPDLDIRVTGGLNRPPMERTAGNVRLFRLAQEIASKHGITLDESSAGGGSDGNFTSALGIPTLDGLGVPGAGGHSVNEYVDLRGFPGRAALLFDLIASL